MKWQELTLKERKQIYDTIRAENPNASYLDIKAVFDAPAYEIPMEFAVPLSVSGLLNYNNKEQSN